MATFTRNAWVTGETITAAGLNGGKGFNILEITADEYDEGFEIEIATGLSAVDFFNTIVSYPSEDGVVASPFGRVVSNDSFWTVANNDIMVFYYPETGVFTSNIPPSDDNGGDLPGGGSGGVS